MGIFFGTHLAGCASAGIKQPRFLIDFAAIFQNFYLPLYLVINGLHDKAHRVQIFGFCARTKCLARAAHRYIHICPQ